MVTLEQFFVLPNGKEKRQKDRAGRKSLVSGEYLPQGEAVLDPKANPFSDIFCQFPKQNKPFPPNNFTPPHYNFPNNVRLTLEQLCGPSVLIKSKTPIVVSSFKRRTANK